MDRRRFLQNLAVATAGLRKLGVNARAAEREGEEGRPAEGGPAGRVPAEG